MTRFMICDTDVEFLQKLAGVLHQLYDPCTVEYMYGPSALEASLAADAGGADILITEIELRSKSAIDIIERNLKPSSPLQIIYMTPKMDYCTEVYRTRHCGFLMKPVQKQMLKRDIARATKLLEMRKEHGIVIQKTVAFTSSTCSLSSMWKARAAPSGSIPIQKFWRPTTRSPILITGWTAAFSSATRAI